MVNTLIYTNTLLTWVREFARIILASKETLSELDSASGDADHGANMERGMVAILAAMDKGELGGAPADCLKKVGMTLVDTVGGSSGALYGTIFLRMARSVGEFDHLDAVTFARALQGGLDGVAERGKVKPGDKTMYDALAPAVQTLTAAVAQGMPLSAALQAALEAAMAGRDATIGMAARKGKSSYVGEKSIGHQDPGATSVTMMIAAAAATLGRPS